MRSAISQWGQMAHTLFIVGMAGSGKSTLTAAYLEWLKSGDRDVLVVNLDPGAIALPYNPDIDARQYVDVEKLMLDYQLGPNGALIMASDLLADHLEEIRTEIEEANPDLVLIDTPGQIELFALRESGRFIVRQLTEDNRALIYLMDAPFTRSPLNFTSNVYLAAAIYSRIMQPQIYVLTKSDLVTEEQIDEIVDWTTESEALDFALRTLEEHNFSTITRDLANAVFATGLLSEPIPISAKTNSGFVELNAAVTRILTGGEEEST
jgi:GTPase SAR1 family protein